MTLAIGILTYERPDLLRATLQGLWPCLDRAAPAPEVVMVDNGSSPAVLTAVRAIARQTGAHLIERSAPLPPTADPVERDRRIAEGFSRLASALLETGRPHALLLEDDWDCVRPLPLAALAAVLEAHPHLGQIRLRDCPYDNSLHGCSTRNFVTGEAIRLAPVQALEAGAVLEGNLHWTNNPSLVRRDALDIPQQCHGSELDMMRAFQARHPRNGQLWPGAFVHRGPVRHRPDLEAAGVFGPPGGSVWP